jgi:outer membrane protein TolC
MSYLNYKTMFVLRLRSMGIMIYCLLFYFNAHAALQTHTETIYQWMDSPNTEALRVKQAGVRLRAAIANPETVLNTWVELPTSPTAGTKKTVHLTLREAILLALRYNPNIQNAELDRIIQRYQLRLANNEFELQYALGASGVTQRNTFSGVGSATTNTLVASPELNLKTKAGTTASLTIDNNASIYNGYNPILNFSLTQPLLRGLNPSVNKAALLNAIDNEWLNKLNLQQAVIDQITQVIIAYRALILSINNLQNQRLQLKEANKSFTIN